MDLNVILPREIVLMLPLILALGGAALLLMLRNLRNVQAALAIALVLTIAAIEALLLFQVITAGPVSVVMGNWPAPFGISFAADIASASFALASGIVALAVLVYAQADRQDADDRDGFYPLVLLLLAGVTGAFLTRDIFNLYVWFEVMLIASFGLMVVGGRDDVLDSAIKYGFLNLLATTIFLLALGLLYGAVGTLDMGDVAAATVSADPLVLSGIGALFLLAFGIKAAAFPVNAWLPAAYHTPPAAISALLAGLLTKVGVYALLRVFGAVLRHEALVLRPVLMAVVILTLLVAALGAMVETNLRRALGFLVISGIGIALSGLAIFNTGSLAGSAFYVFHAILTITALYLAAGLIEKVSGQTDTRRMGGLYARHSLLAVFFFVLILATVGVPPLLGFWPKFMLLSAAMLESNFISDGDVDFATLALAFILLINAVLTLIAGMRIWSHVFWRAGPEGAQGQTEPVVVRTMTTRETGFGLGAVGILTLLIIALSLMPRALIEAAGAAGAGLTDPLALSAVQQPGVQP